MWRVDHRLFTTLFMAMFVISGILIDGQLGIVAAQSQQSPGESSKMPSPPALPADTNQPPAASDTPQTKTGERRTTYTTTKTPYEFYLAALTIVLGVSAMLVVAFLFRNHIHDKTDEFVKLFAFVVVVFSAIFLIIAGYTDSQVAPAYSLLGTIIGYIFGRESSAKPTTGAPNNPQTTTGAQPQQALGA